MILDAVALFLTGFVSLIGQIILLRELTVAFFGIELVYLIALGVWLLITAIGAIAGLGRHSPSPGRTATLFLVFALCLPLCVAFLRVSRLVLAGVPGAYLPFPRQMAALVIALAPVALVSGLLFRSAAISFASKGRTLAGAYGIESAGAMAGGLLITICLRWGIQNFPLALAGALITATAALLLPRGEGAPRRRGIAAVLATIMAVLLWQAAHLDRWMTALNHPGLLESRDSPYGRVTVTARAGQVSVFIDDALAFETEGPETELFAHLTALQHPNPQRILVLGGGMDGTLRELIRHRPARIDAVELDRTLVAMTRRHLPEELRSPLSDPSVHLIMADPRRFLAESGAAYDLILICAPEPSSGRDNRFYTREFFGECALRLDRGGIIGLKLPTAENFWTPQTISRTASILRALAAVFPETRVLPGTTTVITASRLPLPRDPDIVVERLRERSLRTRLVTAPYLRYIFTNDRRNEMERRLQSATVAMNTDLRPVCYPYAIMLWLAKFFPKLAVTDLPGIVAARLGFEKDRWLPWLGLPLFFLMSRLRPAWRRWVLVAVAAFLGMVFESILILTYQARQGVLYQDIGLLLVAFMAGLALGAWFLNEAVRWTGARKPHTHRWGLGLIAGYCAYGALVYWYVGNESQGGLLSTASLLTGAGFLVAGILAYAGLYRIRNQREVIAPLYAADLLGGCLGSLLGSIILIPVFGLDGSAVGMIALAALAVLLV